MEVMLVLSLLCEGKAEDQLAYCFQVCVCQWWCTHQACLPLTVCLVACCSCLMLMAVTLW